MRPGAERRPGLHHGGPASERTSRAIRRGCRPRPQQPETGPRLRLQLPRAHGVEWLAGVPEDALVEASPRRTPAALFSEHRDCPAGSALPRPPAVDRSSRKLQNLYMPADDTHRRPSEGIEGLERLKGRLRAKAQRREICLLAAEIGSADPAGDETRGRRRWSSQLRARLASWWPTDQRIRREKELRASRHRAWKGSIAKILSWAEQLIGARLPRRAWDCRSFRFETRDRTARCRAIVAQSALRSLWLFRLRELDSYDPRLSWNWEATVERLAGSAPTLTVRIHTEVASPVSETEHSPLSRMPEFIGGIAREFSLWSGTVRLDATPTWVAGEAATGHLGQELVDPGRKCVAILVMGSDEGAAGQLRPDALSESLAGIAKVFELTAESARALSGWLGLDLTEGGTCVRVVSPGVGSDTDWSDQLKFDSEALASAEGARMAADWMMSVASTVSLEQFRLPSDVTPFNEARRALQRRRRGGGGPSGSTAGAGGSADPAAPPGPPQQGARAGWLRPARWIQAARASVSNLARRSENAKLKEYLAAKQGEVRRLTDKLQDAEESNKWLSDEHAKAEDRAVAAEQEVRELRPRLEELERRLRGRGEDPDIPMPESWAGFESWLAENLADWVQLHPRASREIRKTAFKDVAEAARGVIWLATRYRDARISGTGSDLRGPCERAPGLSNERCGGDSFQIDWGGGKAEVGWHVKNTNTMDPERCLRIYYLWDATNQQVVIASMPGHV